MGSLSGAAGFPVRRLLLLAFAAAALLAGLTGALVLLGLPMPASTVRIASGHGVLMALGFLGTLIALERAVALGRRWAYVAPLSAGLGSAALIIGMPAPVAYAGHTLAAAVLVAMYVAFDRIEPVLHTRVQAVGALAWLAGGLLLLAGRPVRDAVPWLAALLVMTIAGERLELSRLRRLTEAARRRFVVATVVFCTGVVISVALLDAGLRLAGLGLLALAAWLARHDLARRTVRTPGVTRFVALALLAGYAWLAVAGAAWLLGGQTEGGRAYDAQLHALLLGFVISMVFGHAPVILPAVLRVPLPYQPWFYAHLGLLHASLLLRVIGGDVLGSTAAWQLGGALNVAAMLLFVVSSAAASLVEIRARQRVGRDRARRLGAPT